MLEAFQQAAQEVFLRPDVWGVMLAAAFFGVLMGATPGLTATMAMALLVPVTYWLPTIPALAAIVTMVACAIFAGDIPTTLLRIPGTPASAAYADDAYAFTQRGRGHQALGVCLLFSIVGGLFGSLILMVAGQYLAAIATWFTVAEEFWLYMLGLTCAVLVTRGARLPALVGLLLGLMLSTIGLSAVHAEPRFTLGQADLLGGINFIPAMIGLFGVSEVLKNLLVLDPGLQSAARDEAADSAGGQPEAGSTLGVATQLLGRRKKSAARSGFIGAVIGMLPGAGADIASFVSLAVSRRAGNQGQDADTAALGNIADATTANSASLAGAWIPALVFGIPGDSVTAIVLGVLQMKNVKPGPEIFEKQGSLVAAIYLIFFVANLVLLPVGLLAIRAGGLVVRIPRRVLLPAILFFCTVGAFAINGSPFDVGVMLVMGLLGFGLERAGVPLAPVVLGIILGGPLEERFIQTVTSANGDLIGFVSRPAAALLGGLCALLWVWMVYAAWSSREDGPESQS
ncbi:MAG: tripartite tricarboxylate transporter permease [Gemmataceae bacterium]